MSAETRTGLMELVFSFAFGLSRFGRAAIDFYCGSFHELRCNYLYSPTLYLMEAFTILAACNRVQITLFLLIWSFSNPAIKETGVINNTSNFTLIFRSLIIASWLMTTSKEPREVTVSNFFFIDETAFKAGN